MKPLLFLDVDGVLNVPFHGEQLEGDFCPTWVPAGTRERLKRVLPHYEPVWATAWRGDAHAHHREYLGLSDEPWPYVNYAGYKLPEIIKYAGDRPWVWVDDDAECELRGLAPAFRVFSHSADTMIVVPKSAIGLTDSHVELLLGFAARWGAASADPERSGANGQPQQGSTLPRMRSGTGRALSDEIREGSARRARAPY